MFVWRFTLSAFLFVLLIVLNIRFASSFAQAVSASSAPVPAVRVFTARGVVEELQPQNHMVVIRHEAVTNFMAAMTMPFKVRDTNELAGLQRGSLVNFELNVGEDSSWVTHIVKTGTVSLPPLAVSSDTAIAPDPTLADPKYALLHCRFTNELGEPITLADFRGQALAITFFYTRCPLPDYCPRLSKNFQSASAKLAALSSAPTNWHFISITFDPTFDSAAALHAYAESYGYNPAHWTFLTGAKSDIATLAERCGMKFQNRDGVINHNFRTLIIDASGRLQMVFPTSGDLSDQIVTQIIQGAAATNLAVAQNH